MINKSNKNNIEKVIKYVAKKTSHFDIWFFSISRIIERDGRYQNAVFAMKGKDIHMKSTFCKRVLSRQNNK